MDFRQENFCKLNFKLDLNDSDLAFLWIENAFFKFKEFIDCTSDRFVILIHLVMLQNGFMHVQNEQDGTQFLVKNLVHSQLCYNSCKYNDYEIKFDSNSVIIINFKKNLDSLIVHVILSDFKNENKFNVNLKEIDTYLDRLKKNFNYLNALIVDFKNSILSPLRLFIFETHVNHEWSSKTIFDTPYEILVIILKKLDIHSIMNLSASCKFFRNFICDESILIYKDTNTQAITFSLVPNISEAALLCNSLWEYLFQRDFGKKCHGLLVGCNFYDKYIGFYLINDERPRPRAYRHLFTDR